MKLVTWNVNSIKARLPNMLAWLREARPDIVLLQETKTQDESFPYTEIEDLGYNIAIHGQKSYNGVAILSKFPIEDVVRTLPGDAEDDQARYIEAVTHTLRVISVYVPNGRELDGEHFQYKIKFFERLTARMKDLMQFEEKLVLGGDFNVAPTPDDVFGSEQKTGRLLCSLPERQALRTLVHIGLIDAVRERHPAGTKSGTDLYSWWDYRAGSWQANTGMRIDMLYLSPQAADYLSDAGIDIQQRSLPKASDHAPVWCTLKTTS